MLVMTLSCCEKKLSITLFWIVLAVISPLLHAQTALDGFAPVLGSSGAPGESIGIDAIHVQPDGRILVAGRFVTINGVTANNIARLHADGSLDDSFDAGTRTNDSVSDMLIQSDGKLVIVGNFTGRAARLNADGSTDNTFNPGGDVPIGALTAAFQSDEKVIIAGFFGIRRLNTDGSLDANFNGPGFNNIIRDLAVLPDDSIIAVGDFTFVGTGTQRRIVRLLPDGQVDTAFATGEGANNRINAITLGADGFIYIGGQFFTFDNATRRTIARLLPSGALDTSYVPALNPVSGQVFNLHFESDGKLLAAGVFSNVTGTIRNLARLLADGSIADSLPTPSGTVGSLNVIAIQQDDQILLGGSEFRRINRLGNPDVDFDSSIGLDDQVRSVVWESDEQILAGGNFTTINSDSYNRIARLNTDGSTDTDYSIGSGPNNLLHTISVLANDDIAIGGNFTNVDSTARDRVASLDSSGALISGFAPNLATTGVVLDSARQSDGKLIIVGTFTTVNGASRNRIARLNADGSLDTGFNPGNGANNSVFAVALDPTGKIWIAGAFTQYNGQTRNRVAKLNSNGTLDTNINSGTGADADIFDIALQLDGKVLIGGQLRDYNGTARRGIARLLPNTSLDASFDTELGALFVETIAPQANGKILIGGSFTLAQGMARQRITRLNADGSLDSDFDSAFGADATVFSMQLQPNGKAVVGGLFTSLGGETRNRVGRFSLPEAALQKIELQGDTLTWTIGGSMPVPSSVFFETSNDGVNFFQTVGSNSILNNGVWERNLVAVDAGFAWLRATGRFGPNADYSFTRRVRVFPELNVLAGSAFDFGDVPVGTTKSISLGITNPGDARLVITGVTNISAPFSTTGQGSCGDFPITINPGRSCGLGLSFSPTEAGPMMQTIMLESNALSSPDPLMLTGTGAQAQLSVTPGIIGFGDQPVNTASAPRSVTLSNIGNAPLQVDSIDTANAPFALTGGNCGPVPLNVAAGDSCTLDYTFMPDSTGIAAQSIVIASNSTTSPNMLQLNGNGTQAILALTPDQVNFGDQAIDSTSTPLQASLTNNGGAVLMISSITGPTSPFAAAGGSCGPAPIMLLPNDSCSLNYTFSPTVTGPAGQTISITSNALSTPDDLQLTGNGIGAMLSVMPGILDFGDWPLGMDSDPEIVVIDSIGEIDLQVNTISIIGPDAGDFVLIAAADQCSNVTVPIGDFCGFEIVFNPSASGIREAQARIISNAPSSPDFVELLGTSDVIFFDGFDAN